jgi:hypothetical protein
MDLQAVIDFLQYFALVLYAILAILSLIQWRARPSRPGGWMAGTFVVLSIVTLFGLVIPEQSGGGRDLLVKIDIAVLLMFPYFLYRFAASFQPISKALEVLAASLTLIVVGWTFVLSHFPNEGEPTPASFEPYLIALATQWVVLSSIMAVRLWRAGHGQSWIARRRMRLMSVAAGLLNLVLIISVGSGGNQSEGVQIATSILGYVAVVALFVGYSPPEFIRAAWRKRPVEDMRKAIVTLLSAEDEREVTQGILPHVSQIVGAKAVAFVDAEGKVIDSMDVTPEMATDVAGLLTLHEGNEMSDEMVFRYPTGSMVVWSSPYAPFFGTEESDIIKGVGAMAQLALEKTKAAELKLALAEAQIRRKQALQINDDIVQGLAVAKYAFELGQENKGLQALEETLEAAKGIISELLQEIEPEQALRPGSLVRDTPARSGTHTQR